MKVYEVTAKQQVSSNQETGQKTYGSDYEDDTGAASRNRYQNNKTGIKQNVKGHVNKKPGQNSKTITTTGDTKNRMKFKNRDDYDSALGIEKDIADLKTMEDAPTMTGKQAALKKQQQAALLKSKTTDSGMVDRMNVVGKGMQDKVAKTQADADSLSRAAGIDPNQVNKDIKTSLSGKPKLRDKFRKQ